VRRKDAAQPVPCHVPTSSKRKAALELTGACFIVRDHNGQALAYVYFEEEPGRRSAALRFGGSQKTHEESACSSRRLGPHMAAVTSRRLILVRRASG
jgi:hypothetical protein